MEEMSSCLNTLVINEFKKDKTTSRRESAKEFESMQILMLLSVIINTQILNSFFLFASHNTNHNDTLVLKTFKQLFRKLKELSHIHTRVIHVSGAVESKETSYEKRVQLNETLRKLEKYEEKLESDVMTSFHEFRKAFTDEIGNKAPRELDFLSFAFEYLMNLFHSQYAPCKSEVTEEEKDIKYWRSPYSEISKMMQFSIVVEYEIGTKKHTVQMDIPFIFKLRNEAVSGRRFYKVLNSEIRKYAMDNLYDQGVQKSTLEDISIRIVNQPEVFALTLEGGFDSIKFYTVMEDNEFRISDIGKLGYDDKSMKRYYPKHAIFWNTKHSYYEKFTLNTFKCIDEKGTNSS